MECTFTAKKDGPIYAYSSLLLNEESGYTGNAMRCLGNFKKGETVTDYIELSGPTKEDAINVVCSEYYVAYPNEEVLSASSEKIRNASGTLEKITDSHLTGTFSSKEDGRLFFTIPYDEGWSLKVDGKPVKLSMAADLFMEAPVTAGDHSYELTFFPKGMKSGMVVSGVGVLLLLVLIALNIYFDRKRGQKDDTV